MGYIHFVAELGAVNFKEHDVKVGQEIEKCGKVYTPFSRFEIFIAEGAKKKYAKGTQGPV